jgi:hypothetical protein
VTITGAVPTNYNVTARSPCVKVSNKDLTFSFTAAELTPTSPAGGTITSSSALSRTISSMTRPTGSWNRHSDHEASRTRLQQLATASAILGASDSIYNGDFLIAGACRNDVHVHGNAAADESGNRHDHRRPARPASPGTT